MGSPKIVDVACRSGPAARNFQRAVLDGIPRSQYEGYTDRLDTDRARIWGVRTEGTWEKTGPGDYLFFYTQYEEYRYVAKVVGKEVNRRLAKEIFESEDDSYEYLFYLASLREISLDSKKLRVDYAGYATATPTATQRMASDELYKKIDSRHGSIEAFIRDHQIQSEMDGHDRQTSVAERLREKLQTVLGEYETTLETNDWDHSTLDLIKEGIPADVGALLDDLSAEPEVDHAKFVGRLANVPWVSVSDRRVSEGAHEGLYVVYLFDVGKNELYLTLNQGVKHLRDEYGMSTAREILRTRAEILRRHVAVEGFKNDEIAFSPDLVTQRNTLFQNGTVCHRTYRLEEFPDAATLEEDLRTLVREYIQLVDDGVYEGVEEAFDPDRGVQGDPGDDPSEIVYPKGDVGDLLDRESRQAAVYRRALTHLVAGKNVVFYGPPGTGKTRAARLIAKRLCHDYKLVTANAEWANYDVVGGYAPGANGWEPSPGFLTQAAMECQTSLERASEPKPSWLIVDELNRANLDQAFGEVFTLLDLEYRGTEALTYAGQEVRLPLSFRILATMNTYDQAQLFSLGYAFRRRFAFVAVPSLLDVDAETASTSRGTVSVEFERDSETEWLRTLVQDAAVDSLFVDPGGNATGIQNDFGVVYPAFGSVDRIQSTIESIENDDAIGAGSLGYLDTLIAFAQGVTSRDVVDVGQALLIDAAKYVIVHQMLFPDETDHSTVDDAVVASIVPQFDTFMSELRRAETIDRDSDATDRYDEVIELARALGLNRTAATLDAAGESKKIFG